ncbi:MAG: lipocalin family protein [Fibrobacteraceae bacterium]
MRQRISIFFLLIFSTLLLGCSATNNNVSVVTDFNKDKYLGKWYEIARLDFRFEKDLNNTTAEYLLVQDKIKVINRGFNYKTLKWKEAVGKAKFKDNPTKGALLVSFFGPFYGEYNIIALDSDYQYALIAGNSTKYLWILSRTRELPESIKSEYLNIAKTFGYDINKLIWVEHNK